MCNITTLQQQDINFISGGSPHDRVIWSINQATDQPYNARMVDNIINRGYLNPTIARLACYTTVVALATACIGYIADVATQAIINKTKNRVTASPQQQITETKQL